MAFKIRKAGAWADTGTVNIRKAGAWATAGFVKVMKSGSWALVWPNLIASLTGRTVSVSGASAGGASVIYRVAADGLVYTKLGTAAFSSVETWLDAGANTQFQVRYTQTGTNGIGAVTGTLNTWLNTTADNDLQVNGAGSGQTASRTFDVEIRENITNVVLTIAVIQMDAERL